MPLSHKWFALSETGTIHSLKISHLGFSFPEYLYSENLCTIKVEHQGGFEFAIKQGVLEEFLANNFFLSEDLQGEGSWQRSGVMGILGSTALGAGQPHPTQIITAILVTTLLS